ncbi:hypothetical protein BGX21_002249 [Mortierella sp. AD011]|nr:hypothetical protein BGX20_003403 [Mortierella sp. AD010]KAF9380844.1 hypothetical protein BGX21_002249 [Mortierella sp. AD011]
MNTTAPLKILIVGADISTLTLALMLEQAGIDYLLLEPSDSVPVVAGAITLHPTVLPLMEQLNLRDDLFFCSQPLEQVHILDTDMEYISSYDWSDRQTRYGAWSRFMSRPEYCSMILEKLPESKIMFNKIVTSVSTMEHDHEKDQDVGGEDDMNTVGEQAESILDDNPMDEKDKVCGVTVECADGSVYSAHLMIGDINSGVERKMLYTSEGFQHNQHQQRESEDRLAPVRETRYHVSGITETLDPQRIPLLKEDTTQLRLVLDSKSSLSWWVATLVDNRIAWQVTKRVPLSEKSSRPLDFGSFHHEQAAAAAVVDQISQTAMNPLGGTMGQLLDWTPQSQISCKRWDDRRAQVNEKSVPTFGQASEETILDALALSEVLVSLPSTKLDDIRMAFERYHKERTTRRESAIDESRELDQTLNAKGLRKIYRSIMLNYLPKYIHDRKNDEKYSYRPQASFLQNVPDYGLVQPNGSRRHSIRIR